MAFFKLSECNRIKTSQPVKRTSLITINTTFVQVNFKTFFFVCRV